MRPTSVLQFLENSRGKLATDTPDGQDSVEEAGSSRGEQRDPPCAARITDGDEPSLGVLSPNYAREAHTLVTGKFFQA